jgi:hypothetical protein
MNERIRELSDIAYKNHLARNPHSSFGRRSDYDRELAELIVRQCAQMLDEDTYLIPELGGYAHDMRQRFGIQD